MAQRLKHKKPPSRRSHKATVNPPVKKRRKRRRGRQTLNYLFFGIVGAIVLAILSYTVFFRVYNIEVTGDNQRYTSGEIIAASGIKDKQSLFSVSGNVVNAGVVSKLPYVQGINVTKRFPTTVRLEVLLAEVAGAVECEEGYLYIGGDGRILEGPVSEYTPQHPIITGIVPSSKEVGSHILPQNSDQIIMLKSLLAALERAGLEKISYIALGNKLNMRVVYDNRLLIELGTESKLDYKLEFVKRTIENNMNPSMQGVMDATMIDKWVTYYDDDINALLEEERLKAQDEQEAIAPDGETPKPSESKSGIIVDPETGAIIVGPRDPLNRRQGSSSQQGEGEKDSGDKEAAAGEKENDKEEEKEGSGSSSQPEKLGEAGEKESSGSRLTKALRPGETMPPSSSEADSQGGLKSGASSQSSSKEPDRKPIRVASSESVSKPAGQVENKQDEKPSSENESNSPQEVGKSSSESSKKSTGLFKRP